MQLMKTAPLALSFLFCFSVTWGQLPSARFDSVYPPSAQQGEKLEVKVTGQDLEGVKWLKFSHDAIKAEPKKDADGEIVPNEFVLKVAPNAPLGIHKGWIGGGKFGASNYRSFVVGDLPQVDAGEGGVSQEKAFGLELGKVALGKSPASKFAWFKFPAKKGQRVLVEVSTKDIDSKLTPSVALYNAAGLQLQSDPQNGLLDFTIPDDGDWFVRLNDFLYKGGDEYQYRMTVSTRPRIDLVYPPVGKAGSNAKFTIYGRNLPGGQPSEWKTKDGRTLEKKEVNIQLPSGDARAQLNLTDYLDPRRASLDHLEYRIQSPAGISAATYVGYGEHDVIHESEGENGLPGNEQKITAPCEFVGKFFPGSDKDRMRFTAKKGDVYQIEIFSERLGRPTHVFLLLEQLTKKDDGEETAKEIGKSLETASTLGGSVFDVSTRDPSLRFSAPADGDYRILVYDLFNTAPDPLNVYRLSIRKETPDFRLAAYGLLPPPASNNASPVYVKSPTIRKGEAFPVKVMALRRDGFKDPIDLEVKGLPAFVSYSPKRVPAGADSVTMLFQPNDKATDWDGLFSISGKAKVAGKEVRRDCRFADVAWSSYDNQSKVALSHVHVVPSVPFAVLGREATPVKVVFDDAKLVESAKKAAETAEKSFKDAQTKLGQAREKLKAPVEAEKKAEAEAAAKKKELADKQKERDDLVNVRLKAAKEKAKQGDAESTKEVAALEAEAKKMDQALKTLPNQIRQAEQKATAANTAADKARAEAMQAEAAEAGKKKELEAKKAKLAEATKRKDSPTGEVHVFETAVSGQIKIPFKLDCTDAFKASTKVKIFGHAGFAKVKEITVDPKKKNEGTIDLNLAQAKLPAGEYPLFCSAQVKGKYKVFSEEEAKKASEDAKKVDESLKAAKTAAAEAKKALAEGKKKLDQAKKAKEEGQLAQAEKEYMELESKTKDADAKAKRLENKKKSADALAKKMTDASKKPKDVTVTLFTNPFTLKVREVPMEMKPLEKQTLKAGEKATVDLAIDRLFGFADAVSFKLVAPREAKGVSAKAASIAKDGYATTLEVVTSATATPPGEYECKLEGTLKFNNQNLKFTKSFVLKVEPAPEKKG